MSPISPRLVSVLVTGDDLDGFADAAPTSHLKVFLPADGQDEPNLPEFTPGRRRSSPATARRRSVRTYTPRRYDPATKTLEIQFLLHGDRARVGVGAAGQAGRQARGGRPGRPVLARAGRRPLVARRRRVRHPGRRHPARGAAGDGRGRRPPRGRRPGRRGRVRGPAKTTISWHHRRRPDAFGAELAEAARAAAIPDGARIWVACEAAAMRDIRRYFIARARLSRRPSWSPAATGGPASRTTPTTTTARTEAGRTGAAPAAAGRVQRSPPRPAAVPWSRNHRLTRSIRQRWRRRIGRRAGRISEKSWPARRPAVITSASAPS